MADQAEPRARAPRRTDPDRRNRIIDACLDVIATEGVAGTSHRKVAAVANVPLGSMTYHFSGMDELLQEAFTRFTLSASDRFEKRMSRTDDRTSATRAIIDALEHDILTSRRDLVLTHELYTLAAREPAYRLLTHSWMLRSRATLESRFDPTTARALDALIEGLSIHRALDIEPQPAKVVSEAVQRLVDGDLDNTSRHMQ